ncbi:uncharacterized protein LOC118525076 [Halichoerus grypus]
MTRFSCWQFCTEVVTIMNYEWIHQYVFNTIHVPGTALPRAPRVEDLALLLWGIVIWEFKKLRKWKMGNADRLQECKVDIYKHGMSFSGGLQVQNRCTYLSRLGN